MKKSQNSIKKSAAAKQIREKQQTQWWHIWHVFKSVLFGPSLMKSSWDLVQPQQEQHSIEISDILQLFLMNWFDWICWWICWMNYLMFWFCCFDFWNHITALFWANKKLAWHEQIFRILNPILSLWRPNGCVPIWVMGTGHPRDYMTNHLTKF